jgi:hypothetical protein
MVTTVCYYGDTHQRPSAWVRIEIAKKDGTVQRKMIRVTLVPTLAVDSFCFFSSRMLKSSDNLSPGKFSSPFDSVFLHCLSCTP